MKKKFIRILSPITLIVIALLDIAVISFAVFSVKKIIEVQNLYSIFFAAIEILAIIVAVLVTKETIGNGIVFYEDRLEFTGIDDKNVFLYGDIARSWNLSGYKGKPEKEFYRQTFPDNHYTEWWNCYNSGYRANLKKVLIEFKKELAEHIGRENIKN